MDDNPLYDIKPMVVSNGGNTGSSVELQKVPVRKPYTMQGLCLYLGCNTSYFRVFKATNKNKCEDFLTVIANIEEVVYMQKFEGAASGHFNAQIIARDLGLVDRQDKTSGDMPIGAPTINIYKNGAPPLSSEESKQ